MKILVLGASGTLGRAFVRALENSANHSLEVLTREDVDFSVYLDSLSAIKEIGPDLVINCVGSVGGVKANLEHPFELVTNNSLTTTNIARVLHYLKIDKYCYFAPACIYPASNQHVATEMDLWQGNPEISSRPYASSKLMGIELIRSANNEFNYNWKVFIPTNVFGIGDWKHINSGHVISMVTQKILHAKKEKLDSLELWGTGKAVRDFISSDSLAAFVVANLDCWNYELPEISNVPGYGPITIEDLAKQLCRVLDFKGKIIWNSDMPEGSKFKVLGQAEGLKKVHHNTSLEEELRLYVSEFASQVLAD